jgi:hypothetical protein
MIKILAYSTMAVVFTVVLTGCETMPTGPHVEVLPAPGKPFETFMEDEQTCRGYAQNSVGQSRNEAGTHGFANATAGSMPGTESGLNTSDSQQRYDIAYAKCMYAKGNQIPVTSQPLQ